MTNHHVIADAKQANVVFRDGKRISALGFVAVKPQWDLAILVIRDNPQTVVPLSVIPVAPQKGDRVLALGSPEGLSGSISEGIVSSLRSGDELVTTFKERYGRDVYTEVFRYDPGMNWIQTTAPISHGNSGGPLVNDEGEVVGVNTLSSVTGQNLNFAVSCATLWTYCGMFRSGRSRRC